MKNILLALGMFILPTTSALGFETWQVVSGPKLSVLLNERAEPVNPSIRIVNTFNLSISQDSSAKDCPATNQYINRIYSQLVQKNNLQAFIDDGPGMGIFVNCVEAKPFPRSIGPATLKTTIVLPAYLVSAADFDDEIAATLAHEMSHILLDHEDQKEKNLKAKTVRIEAEADVLGTLLMANAGYNPRFMKSDLEKLIKFLGGGNENFLVRALFDDGHGSLRTRGVRIDASTSLMALRESGPISSPDLAAAQLEVRLLAQKAK
jgi:hypothetical protein